MANFLAMGKVNYFNKLIRPTAALRSVAPDNGYARPPRLTTTMTTGKSVIRFFLSALAYWNMSPTAISEACDGKPKIPYLAITIQDHGDRCNTRIRQRKTGLDGSVAPGN